MSDVKVQAVVEASTEGVERAFDRVGDKAVQMASKVDQAAQKAGGSVDSIGKGAGGSADQLNRAEGRMVASIKRVQTQMELAGKTASQKFEFNIAAKGLDAAKFEPYLMQLRKMEAAALSTSAVSTSAFSSMGSAVTAFGVAAGAAVLGAVYAFDSLVKKAGDFQDMAEKVGGSAEGLASMAVAAATAGAQMDTVAGAMNRMTNGLVGVDDTSKNAGAAISALGLQLGSFRELAPEDQMEAVAKALAGFEDGASKSAVAMALFGKSGAELMPFLKELGAEGGRQQILTQAQIALADEYADKQAKLTAEIGLYAQSIAIQALPAMNDLFGAFADSLKEIAGVNDEVTGLAENNGVAEFAGGAVKALAFVMDSVDGVSRAFQIVGKSIAGATAIATSPYTQSGAIWDAMSEDINQVVQRTTVLGALQERTAKRAVESISTVREELKKLNYSGEVKPISPLKNGSAKNDTTQQYAAALAAEKDFAASQIKIINARVSAGVESEESGIKEILAAKVAGFDKEREILNAQLAKTSDKGDKTKIEQQIAAIGTASTVAASEAEAAFSKIEQARNKYMQGQIESANNSAFKIEDENDALREQIDILGMSEQQIGEYEAAKINAAAGAEYLAAANLREAASSIEAAGVASDAIPYYRQLAEAREAAGNALSEKAALESTKGIKKSAIDAAKEWEKTSDKIGDSITDALMRGFESGKSFAETLRDTVVNMFKTMVLQPTIKAVVVGGLSAVGMGSATAADGSSTGGIGNMLSTGKSIYSTGSSVYDVGSQWLGGTMSGANAAGTLYANATGTGLDGLLATNGAYGTAAGTAAAADLGATIGTAAGTALAGSSAGTVFATTMTGAAVNTTTMAGVALASGTAPLAGGAATGAMAAVPVVGWIAAAAAAAYAIFGHEKHDPTEGVEVTSTNAGNGSNYITKVGDIRNDGYAYNAVLMSNAAAINKQYLDTLNPFLAAMGNTQTVSIATHQIKKDNQKKSTGFDVTVGDASSHIAYGYGKDVSDADALAQSTASAMGEAMSRAILLSDLAEPIRRLFDGVLDQGVVQDMMTGLTKVGNASKELNDVWGISVSQAAEVAMLTGQTQEGVAKTVDAIGTFAAAQRTVGATLESAYASMNPIFDALTNSALPDNLSAYDAAMKSVDTTVDGGIETFAALFAMREGFAQFRAAIDGLKTSASSAIDAFRTPEERLKLKQSALSDLSTKAGIAVPTSGAELVKMFDSIDFTKPTQEGMNLAAALPAIAAAFTDVQTAATAAAKAEAERVSSLRASAQEIVDGVNANFKSISDAANVKTFGLSAAEVEANQTLVDALNSATAGLGSLKSLGLDEKVLTRYTDQLKAIISEQTNVLSVSVMKSRTLDGDANGALASALSTVMPSITAGLDKAGNFVAASFNRAMEDAQAKANVMVGAYAAANALSVENYQNFAGMGANGSRSSDYLGTASAQAVAASDYGTTNLPSQYALRSIVAGAIAESARTSGRDETGLNAVYAARSDAQYLDALPDRIKAANAAVAQLGKEFDKGQISAKQLAAGMDFVSDAMGDVAKAGDVFVMPSADDYAAMQDAADEAIKSAGYASLQFYFGKLDGLVGDLAEAAAAAATPLAQVNSAIGLLKSAATVFGQSAAAAAGGDAVDVGSDIGKAQTIADAAAKASGLLTTQTSQAVQDTIALSSAFADMSDSQRRDASLMLDGVSAFDNTAFYNTFLKLSDALKKGGIDTTQYTELFNIALDTTTGKATDAAAALASIASERDGLESRLLQAQGNTVAIRARELAALDASNRALQMQIWALEDQKTALEAAQTNANAAYATLERAVAAQRKATQAQIEAAQAAVTAAQEQAISLKSIFDNLKSNVASLYDAVDSTAATSAAAGQSFIAQTLANAKSNGAMPNAADLADSISSAIKGVDTSIYASQVDADSARLELAGKLSQLQDISGTQLTAAEQQLNISQAALKAAQDQLASYDDLLEVQKSQLDVANGIDISVISVADAVKALGVSLTTLATATKDAASSSASLASAAIASAQATVQATSTSSNSALLSPVVIPNAVITTSGVNADVVAELREVRAQLVVMQRQLDIANASAARTANATNGNQEHPVLVEIAE